MYHSPARSVEGITRSLTSDVEVCADAPVARRSAIAAVRIPKVTFFIFKPPRECALSTLVQEQEAGGGTARRECDGVGARDRLGTRERLEEVRRQDLRQDVGPRRYVGEREVPLGIRRRERDQVAARVPELEPDSLESAIRAVEDAVAVGVEDLASADGARAGRNRLVAEEKPGYALGLRDRRRESPRRCRRRLAEARRNDLRHRVGPGRDAREREVARRVRRRRPYDPARVGQSNGHAREPGFAGVANAIAVHVVEL